MIKSSAGEKKDGLYLQRVEEKKIVIEKLSLGEW